MKKITFLGPVGATFSHDAYNVLAETYDAPKAIAEGQDKNCIPASTNGEIIKSILLHRGYGAIAMETLAEGRVAEPLESFIDLLKRYKKTEECPFHVIGAVKMRLHFCLMARKDLRHGSSILKVVAHPKAFGPCKGMLFANGLSFIEAKSNGEAARLVAESEEYSDCAALGPQSAAEKYDLKVLVKAFEDSSAITTFFLLGPKEHKVSVGKENRVLIVFKAPHKPGSLVRSLMPFEGKA